MTKDGIETWWDKIIGYTLFIIYVYLIIREFVKGTYAGYIP